MTDPIINTAVVYHSGYGHTQRMAQAVAQGAEATLVPIDAEGIFRTTNGRR
jgi:multimeric flavodoxin WrbA